MIREALLYIGWNAQSGPSPENNTRDRSPAPMLSPRPPLGYHPGRARGATRPTPIPTDLSMDDVRQLRIDLAAAYRWAVRFGLNEGISNHFSVALDDDTFLINPHGLHWSEITASSVLVCDIDGKVLEGDHPVEPTALFIHGQTHRAAPHAKVVLHTHMPYATALTMLEGGRLEPVEQNAIRFHGKIAYDDAYNGLALDADEGARIASRLGNKKVMFLANHGVVVIGPTVAEAFDDLYYVERAAMFQVLAMSTGRPYRRIPEKVVEDTVEQMSGERETALLHFAALKRILDREEPDYAH